MPKPHHVSSNKPNHKRSLSPSDAGLWAVFAKPPVPGQVKTRLAASTGMSTMDAAKLAWGFLVDTLQSLGRTDACGRLILATTAAGLDPRVSAPLGFCWPGEGGQKLPPTAILNGFGAYGGDAGEGCSGVPVRLDRDAYWDQGTGDLGARMGTIFPRTCDPRPCGGLRGGQPGASKSDSGQHRGGTYGR